MSILNEKIIEESKSLMGENFIIMMQYFLEDVSADIHNIKDGISEQDSKKIRTSAHTIKSSSKLVGAENMSEVAVKIEQMAIDISNGKITDFTNIASLFSQLQQAFTDVEPELKALASK